MAKGDIISRLRLESGEFDSKIKRAGQELLAYAEHCKKMSQSMGYANQDAKDFAKALGSMQTVSQTARGKINELSEAFVNAKVMYKNMTDEEKKGEFGRNLAASLDQLKTRLNDAKKDLADVTKELNPSVVNGGLNTQLGDLNGILSQVGGQMGINTSMLSGLTAGTMGYAAAVAAVVKAEYEAAKAFKEYNDEMARQSQITTVTTDLKGTDADNMTAAARSISKVYGTDFREVINAANTLMTQFGTDGEFAIQLIRDGMQGMIQGDGPRLLSMIQQFAPSFRDAGISASQLVAIIQNSEGGIFSAENMNAIVMGIKNLRLMTKATSDALAEIGINGEKMTRQLNDGTISIFDALRQVSDALQDTESGSQQAGQVMQQVFGRQGTAAGTNLAKAIATLNTNLEETKRQTGEVGESFAELEKKTEELDKAIMNLLQVDNWDVLTNTIETGVVDGLTKCVNLLNDALDVVNNIGKAFGGPVVQGVVDFLVALSGPVGLIYEAYNLLKGGNKQPLKRESQEDKAQRMATTFIGNINSSNDKAGTYSRDIELLNKTLNKYRENGDKEKADLTQRIIDIVEEHMDNTFSGYGIKGNGKKSLNTTTSNKTKPYKKEEDATEGSIDAQTEKVHELQKAWRAAADDESREKYKKQIEDAQYELDRLEGKVADLSKLRMLVPVSVVPEIEHPKIPDIAPLKQQIKLELKDQNIKVDENTLKTILQDAVQNGIDGMDLHLATLNEQISKGIDVPDSAWQKILDDYNRLREQIGKDPINIEFSTGRLKDSGKRENESAALKNTTKLVAGLNNVSNGLEKMGFTIPEEVQKTMNFVQGLIDVIQGVNTVVSVINTVTTPSAIVAENANTTALGVLTAAVSANTAALAANTTAGTASAAAGAGAAAAGASVLGPIALGALGVLTVGNMFGLFANGGIVPHAENGYFVPGTHYSGDVTPIMANAGELVLNVSSQKSLANDILHAKELVGMIEHVFGMTTPVLSRSDQVALTGKMANNGFGGINVVGEIQGENIVLAANRFFRRTGQGEIVTW